MATCRPIRWDPPNLVVWENSRAIIGNGDGLEITKKGKLDVKVDPSNGSTCDITFNVKVTPEVAHQFLSLTMLIQKGWKVITA